METKLYNFNDDIELLSYKTEEEWHELRKEGIGGSDIGAILGLNKHSSPLKIYRIKKGIWAEDVEDNVYIKKGKELEHLIFQNYVVPEMESQGYRVVHPEHVFVNKQFTWLRANCDGLAMPKTVPSNPEDNVIIEIKWVSEWADVNWDAEEYYGVPASYYAQVQHYMTVTGAKKAKIFAMFDKDWRVKIYTIPYNPSFCCNLLYKSKEFYDNLLAGVSPEITPTLDKDMMPEALELSSRLSTVKSEEMDTVIGNYITVKQRIKDLEKELDTYYNEAVRMYLDGKRPAGPFKMSMYTCKTSKFDSKKFAEDYPEVYERYKTITEYTRTTMNRR